MTSTHGGTTPARRTPACGGTTSARGGTTPARRTPACGSTTLARGGTTSARENSTTARRNSITPTTLACGRDTTPARESSHHVATHENGTNPPHENDRPQDGENDINSPAVGDTEVNRNDLHDVKQLLQTLCEKVDKNEKTLRDMQR